MSPPAANTAAVPPEEVARRIEEYRRSAFAGRLPPQVVYQGAGQLCPWPGCGYRIAGIRFNLERMGDPPAYEGWLAGWWQGPGLVARCPGCNRHVLFGLQGKQAVPDPESAGSAVLPDDWHEKAYLVPRGGD
jgi:hypothetical protein